MNYLVIDLEMCKVPKTYRRNYKYANETIQIGAVLLDEDFKRIGTLDQYVHPQFGVIDPFIEKLTGIHKSNVKNAPVMAEALEHLVDWLGDREYKVYAWSDSDYQQILHEMKSKHLTCEKLDRFVETDRWIDYQKVFKERFKEHQVWKLEDALWAVDIVPEGGFHNGLTDAINTGYLIEKLEKNPELELKHYELPQEDEALCFTIGEAMGQMLRAI